MTVPGAGINEQTSLDTQVLGEKLGTDQQIVFQR